MFVRLKFGLKMLQLSLLFKEFSFDRRQGSDDMQDDHDASDSDKIVSFGTFGFPACLVKVNKASLLLIR